ncbi:phosphoenolpyruvate carboxylase, partial [Alkalihalophilus pseudofirmus]
VYLTEEKKWPNQTEVYRRAFAIMIERVEQAGKSSAGYQSSDELLADLLMIKRSLAMHHPARNELKIIQKLIRQVQLFGFH